jgi:subtilisin family serine protease
LNNIKKEIEMNQQDNETVNYLMSDENDEQIFFQFDDLMLSDAQGNNVKAGYRCCPKNCRPSCGGWISNHNETAAEDDSDENDEQDFSRFTDLTMSAEQSGKIQGGGINPFDDNNHGTHVAGTIGAMSSGSDRGNTLLNHNETAVNDEDEDEESQSLADLAVKDDEQVKGGPVLSGEGRSVKIYLCPSDPN